MKILDRFLPKKADQQSKPKDREEIERVLTDSKLNRRRAHEKLTEVIKGIADDRKCADLLRVENALRRNGYQPTSRRS